MIEIIDTFTNIEFAGAQLALYAERAAYWPAQQALLIADLHLGKAEFFRNSGLAIPSGGSALDLTRLSNLLLVSKATKLWILGDFIHGATKASVWRQHWQDFVRQHTNVDITLITGNHDRSLRNHQELALSLVSQLEIAGICLQHEAELPSPQAVLSGHLHPVLNLPGVGRRPVFWRHGKALVLPAFSAFTGGFQPNLRQQAAQRVSNTAPNTEQAHQYWVC